jgi:dihydroxyacetone kinase
MSVSKHLINKPENVLADSLSGFCFANNVNVFAPLSDNPNVIVRKDYYSDVIQQRKVAIVSGGGAGHEPSHCGFIGKGMLTAAVCGDVFASPSTKSILAAIRLVGSGNEAGVLLIIKCYTGDRLNFGIAAKRAQLEGINVEIVIVNDDVSFFNEDEDDVVGRRGLCGTLFVHKLAGALADQNKSLKEIKAALDSIIAKNQLRTIGVSLVSGVVLPKKNLVVTHEDDDEYGLDCDEIEIGLGIHGERGRELVKLNNSYELIKQMFEYLEFASDDDNKDICLMVNNLGSLSNFEFNIVINDCCNYLLDERKQFRLRRLYCGPFMTSLDMHGFSVTMFVVEHPGLLDLLDLGTNACAWPKVCGVDIRAHEVGQQSDTSRRALVAATPSISDDKYLSFDDIRSANVFKMCLETICMDLIDLKDYLNELDSGCGDGDCGNSLEKLSGLILEHMSADGFFVFDYPHQVFVALSKLMEQCGGTLCALLALASSTFAFGFVRTQGVRKPDSLIWLKCWQKGLEHATQAISEYGGAKANDRSFLDPLLAINDSLKDTCSKSNGLPIKTIVKNLVNIAYDSAESTASMKPRVGRASYVDASLIKTPDAGAMAISSIISAVYKVFLSEDHS